jgi:hypothetical protein
MSNPIGKGKKGKKGTQALFPEKGTQTFFWSGKATGRR